MDNEEQQIIELRKRYQEEKKKLKEAFKIEKQNFKKKIQEEKKQQKEQIASIQKRRKESLRDLKNKTEQERRVLLKLPRYTHGEELMNAISHIVGGGFGLIAAVIGIVYACLSDKGATAITCMVLYGFCMIFLYTMSSIYHFLHVGKAKKVFQRIDHCTVFALIAGTYIPVCGIILADFSPYNWVILAVVLALSALGISLNATLFEKKWVKVLSNVLYLVIGWLIIFFYPWLSEAMAFNGVLYLILGGVMYTVGAILYACGVKKRYFHFIFHIFCILGTLFQYLCILLYGIL